MERKKRIYTDRTKTFLRFKDDLICVDPQIRDIRAEVFAMESML
jgi:hypothetical protein